MVGIFISLYTAVQNLCARLSLKLILVQFGETIAGHDMLKVSIKIINVLNMFKVDPLTLSVTKRSYILKCETFSCRFF